jgi:hypothetical protein
MYIKLFLKNNQKREKLKDLKISMRKLKFYFLFLFFVFYFLLFFFNFKLFLYFKRIWNWIECSILKVNNNCPSSISCIIKLNEK